MAVRIVAHAFEIVHLLTDQNPVQVSVTLALVPLQNNAHAVPMFPVCAMLSSTLDPVRTRPALVPR
jgi:hypothetical protein